MSTFVAENSIVRKIWGRSDTVLFIFAGAAAEFALNKAVDWLYFTGRLPADPIGRLFSTVTYAHRIIFSETNASNQAIDQITSIHQGIEKARGYTIPDWAYRDVLYLLIDYSRSAFEILERKMTEAEKEELFDVFLRVGQRMGLRDLPASYAEWLTSREGHMKENLAYSSFTQDLFKQYRVHLGPVRYWILIQVQKVIVPRRVKELLKFDNIHWIKPVLWVYDVSRGVKLDWVFKSMILPRDYLRQVKALDR
jgi:hypothetical protein